MTLDPNGNYSAVIQNLRHTYPSMLPEAIVSDDELLEAWDVWSGLSDYPDPIPFFQILGLKQGLIQKWVEENQPEVLPTAPAMEANPAIPFDPTNENHVETIHRHFPDMSILIAYSNPICAIKFRAGMLAMREIIIAELSREFKRSLNIAHGAVIGNIWPSLVDEDPGTPCLYDFDELITDYGTEQQKSHETTTSRDAAVEAFVFLEMIGVMKRD